MSTILEVIDLEKHFKVEKGQTLKAVDGVSFTIQRGETLGLVGESGCGKSTIGRTLLNVYKPDGGRVLFKDQDIHNLSYRKYRALTRDIQMIFQDPFSSLNPRKTIGSIIGEGLKIHKIYNNKRERLERVYELLEIVGLNKEHANRFPHEFSGGQRQRIGIARAISLNPEFIVCDEATSALDVSIQAQIINLLIDLQKKLGLTYLFITHDMNMVRYISNNIAVMYLGTLVEKSETEQLFENPKHPYTIGLLGAVPTADPRTEKDQKHEMIRGEAPSPLDVHEGCRFYSRCKFAKEICMKEVPPLNDTGNNHYVACHMVHANEW